MRKQVEKARRAVSRTVKARIQMDRLTASRQVGRLLQVLEESLFQEGQTIEGAKRAAGIANHNSSSDFGDELRVCPYEYRLRCRIETLERMLEARLPVPMAELGAAIGLSDYRTLRDAYRKVTGKSLKLDQALQLETVFDYFNYNLFIRGQISRQQVDILLQILDSEPTGIPAACELWEPGDYSVVRWAIEQEKHRIRRDSDRTPRAIRKILVTISRRLTEPKLTASSVLRELRLKDKSIDDRFKFHFRSTISAYIDKRRASILVPAFGETTLDLEDAGDAVGLQDKRRVVRVLKRTTGESPENFRAPAERLVDLKTWLLAGCGDPAAVRTVSSLLRTSAPSAPTPYSKNFERWYAEGVVWPFLRDLPQAEAVRLARIPIFEGTSLVEILHETARVEGRRDRKAGIAIAEISRAAVLGTKLHGDALKEEKAKSIAWLANAYRLAFNFEKAEELFGEAFKELGARERIESASVAKIHDLNGSLRTSQRRYEEAEREFELSERMFEREGDVLSQVDVISHKAAAADYAGSPEEAIVMLQSARNLLPADERRAILELTVAITQAFSNAQQYEAASRKAVEARRLQPEFADHPALIFLLWTEANIEHGLGDYSSAERKYLAVLPYWQEEPLHAALLSLDLCLLYFEIGKGDKVLELCRVMLPVFDSLRLYEETRVSLELAKRTIALDQLSSLRESIRKDPLLSIQGS